MKITKVECFVLLVPDFRRDLCSAELAVVNGRIPLPEAPGLGIPLDEEARARYCVA